MLTFSSIGTARLLQEISFTKSSEDKDGKSSALTTFLKIIIINFINNY